MKLLLNSSSLLIGLILVFISVLGNRKTINGAIEGAIDSVFFKDNYAELWQVKPGSVHDGDTLRVVRGQQELKVRRAWYRCSSYNNNKTILLDIEKTTTTGYFLW